MKPKKSRRKKAARSPVKSVHPRTRRTAAAKPKSKKPATRKLRRVAVRKPKLKIPPILLEGDHAPVSSASGPGERYSLGPTAPGEHFETPDALPETYGTKKLFLITRDPRCLYACWDLTSEQQCKYNSLSADSHLVLRVHTGSLRGKLAIQVHVHPESRHWFVHVGRGATKYVAELGYNQRDGKWKRIVTSNAALTPSESVSAETTAEFATIPFDLPFARLMKLVKNLARENLPLAQSIEKLRASGHPQLPRAAAFASGRLTSAQERALMEAVKIDKVRRVWIGSLEVTELVRGKLFSDMTSLSLSSWS